MMSTSLMWLSGRVDGGDSNRTVTNYPEISVDSNRIDCLVKKGGLGVEPRRFESPIKKEGLRYIRVERSG